MPINDPKTPFHEQESDEEMTNEVNAADEESDDPDVLQHLQEAEANRQANASTTSTVQRQPKPAAAQQ